MLHFLIGELSKKKNEISTRGIIIINVVYCYSYTVSAWLFKTTRSRVWTHNSQETYIYIYIKWGINPQDIHALLEQFTHVDWIKRSGQNLQMFSWVWQQTLEEGRMVKQPKYYELSLRVRIEGHIIKKKKMFKIKLFIKISE